MKFSRRRAILGGGLTAAAMASSASATQSNDLRLFALKANLLENPIGLGDAPVRLSWALKSNLRETSQRAYRIVAATDPSSLNAPDLWDSGWVESSNCLDVVYDGRALASRQRVWWRVSVKDTHGREAVSDVAFWEMALLQPDDWKAQWVAAETEEMRGDRDAGLYWLQGATTPKGKRCQFRLNFTLPEDADVTLFTVAKTSYAAFMDGNSVDLPPWPSNRWGEPGVAEIPLRLTEGRHVAALSLKGSNATCAILVRAKLKSGRVVRFNGLSAKTSSQDVADWNQIDFEDDQWAIVERFQTTEGQAFAGNGAFLLRRAFNASSNIKSARLYITALGAYEALINGVRVGDAMLAPECMDFGKRVRYRTYDVTRLVKSGANAIGAMVADGWYGSYQSPAGRFAFGDPPLRLLAQLEIAYSDNRVETVTTSDRWKISRSPITLSEIYNGEDYDARLEQPGWASPAFNDDHWLPVGIAENAKGRLEPAATPPIRKTNTLKPRSIRSSGGAFVIDFGQNFAGWLRFKLRGKAGQKITLKFAELLKANGQVDQSNLRAARAADTYVFRGDKKGEAWEPRFTYHGFRYVQIEGLDAAPSASDVTGVVVHTDLPETGHLRIANPLIQQLWQNTLWSQRSNFVSIPTDCPQRDERLGWMGDANVFWDAAAFNMDVAGFTERWMGDVRDAQGANGAFSNVSPNTLGLVEGSAPGWGDAGIILPWVSWKRYGDTAIINQNWSSMERYINFIEAHSSNYIWTSGRGWDFGDWLSLDSKYPGDETTPKDLIGTAVWKNSVDAMVEMARASGRAHQVNRYTELAEKIKAAFVREYVKPDGTISNDSQTGYILALRYNLVPDGLKQQAAAKLNDNIIKRGRLLTTGFLGTPPSLDVLADFGYGSTVYDLLLRTAYPSWGYMTSRGATTIWERWNGDTGDLSMNSYNHYALGAVIGFVYRRIAGIDPIEPGFKRFRVNPLLDSRLTSGGGDYDSVRGRISTAWSLDPKGRFTLKLLVPPNTVSEVHLPTQDTAAVSESGAALKNAIGTRVLGVQNGRLVIEVRSGNYEFDVRST